MRPHEVDERLIPFALRRAHEHGRAIHDRLPKFRRQRSDDLDARNRQELGGLLHANIGLTPYQYRADHLAGTRLDELRRDDVCDSEPFAGLDEVNAARAALVTAESQYTDALAAANSARADLERAVAVPLATFGTGAPQ